MTDVGVSLALSVKMSALLYIPGLLVILFKRNGLMGTMRHFLVLACTQILLARSFLGENTRSYLRNAFDLSRVFLYKWTVNWRFVDEQTFLSPSWAKGLLLGHVTVLAAFGLFRWCRSDGGVATVLSRGLRRPMLPAALSPVSADCESPSMLLQVSLLTLVIRRRNSADDLQSDWCPFRSVLALSILFLVFPTASVPRSKNQVPTPPTVRGTTDHFLDRRP